MSRAYLVAQMAVDQNDTAVREKKKNNDGEVSYWVPCLMFGLLTFGDDGETNSSWRKSHFWVDG